MKDRIKKLRQDLLGQIKKSYENKDSFGGFKSIFKPGIEFPFWDCKEGEHIIDILPWRAGKQHPSAKPGEYTYVLDVWVHYGVGPNDDQYICLAKTYGKPCPICEHRRELQKSGEADEETLKSLRPKRRTVYAIICRDSMEEEEKGIQIWEVAHFFMEKHLVEISKNPRDGGFVLFVSPYKDEGRSISFRKRGRGAGNVEFIGHRLIERDYDIDEKILEKVPSLDELIHIPTYKEVYDAFFGKDLEEESEELDRPEVEEEEKEQDLREDEEKSNESSESEEQVEENNEELTCPEGGVLGRDIDSFEGCADCEIYDQCLEEAERLEEERRRKRRERLRKRS